jgi:hypothetical protein
MFTHLQQLLPRLRRRYGDFLENVLAIPAPDTAVFTFDEDEVARLHEATAGAGTNAVDDQTWRDLLAGRYLAMLSGEASIFGQQALYRRLRAGVDDAACEAHAGRIRALCADAALLDGIAGACAPLRRARTDVARLLFAPQANGSDPWWVHGFAFLGPAFLLAVLASFAWPMAWLAAGLLGVLLVAASIRYSAAVRVWEREAEALQLMLGVCAALGARVDGWPAGLPPRVRELRGEAGRLRRRLSRSTVVMTVPGLKEYVNWFLLGDVRHCLAGRRRVRASLPALRECFLLVADVEADLALARHLAGAPAFCWAARHAGRAFAFDGVVNPLLPQPLPLSIRVEEKGVFLSGRNGVGKSTLLRTIGLNLLAARAFGFCHAAGAQVSTRVVHASMQNEDSLLGGESLYVAELRRARELLASARGPRAGIYLIDEVFRGTNHLESVSAAAAVLDEIARDGLVIVSSHNLVLASILDHCLVPLQVGIADGTMALRPGVLVETNGIALLAERGFDARVQDRANQVFNWLNRYLAHPHGVVDS